MEVIKVKKLPLLYTKDSSVENEELFNRLANRLARSWVQIGQCRKCGHPVVQGYCCSTCKDGSPNRDGEHACTWSDTTVEFI